VIISSPGYHGTISGILKNAIDYVQVLAEDSRPYLDGRAFGSIAVAYGWQAAGTTLTTLRSIGHALRAWPTPYGAAINALEAGLRPECAIDVNVRNALRLVGQQVGDWASGSMVSKQSAS
jgi:FMN reductase